MTCADVVKSVLYTDKTILDYPNYGKVPGFFIFARDDMAGMRPGGSECINCKDVKEDPQYAVNGKRIFARQACELYIAENTSDKRDNMFTDIENLCLASSYSLILRNIRTEDQRNLFTRIFEIHLIN